MNLMVLNKRKEIVEAICKKAGIERSKNGDYLTRSELIQLLAFITKDKNHDND